MKKCIKNIFILIFIPILLSGCSSSITTNEVASDSFSQSNGGAFIESGDYNYSFEEDYIESTSTDISGSQYSEKLVYTCNIRLETLNYTDTIKSIKNKVSGFNGFIEYEYEYDTNYNWYSDEINLGTMHMNLTIRIPSNRYDEFISSLDGDGKILSKSSNVDNITKEYYDISAVIESLKIQEARLITMLESAETIDDMIAVEKRLTEVQTQLNRYKTSLATMDMGVEYSTIELNIDEVRNYTDIKDNNTFLSRLNNTLKESWKSFWSILEGLLFFIIRMIPVVIIFIPIGFIIWILIIKIKKIIKKYKN